jgi:hypothetical protein
MSTAFSNAFTFFSCLVQPGEEFLHNGSGSSDVKLSVELFVAGTLGNVSLNTFCQVSKKEMPGSVRQ